MHMVGVFDAKNRLTALIHEVEGGGEVVITRRGVPVARLTAFDAGFNRAAARQTADALRAASRGQSLAGITIRALIDEGRS